MNTVLTAILNITERLLANGNASLHFMRGFLSPTPNDVSIDWIKADNTVETYSFANIKKFQEEVTARVNAAINNIKQPKIVFKGWNSAHNRAGNTYQLVHFDWIPISAKAPYCTVQSGADRITINTAGQYRFDVFITKHKDNVAGWGHTQIRHNVDVVVKTHERHFHNGAWHSYSPSYSAHFNAGDTLMVDSFQDGSNPYNWHSAGIHGHATLTYLGD